MTQRKFGILALGCFFWVTACQNGGTGGNKSSSDNPTPTPPNDQVVVTGSFDQNYDFTFKTGDAAKTVTLIFKTTAPTAHAGPLSMDLAQIPSDSALQVSGVNGEKTLSCPSVDSTETTCAIKLNLTPKNVTNGAVPLQFPVTVQGATFVQGATLKQPIAIQYVVNDKTATDFTYDFPTDQKIYAPGTFGAVSFEFHPSGAATSYTLDNINALTSVFISPAIKIDSTTGTISWGMHQGTDAADFVITAHFDGGATTTKTYHLNFSTDYIAYDSSPHAIDIGENPSENTQNFKVVQDVLMPGQDAYSLTDADNASLKDIGMTFSRNTGIFEGTPKKYFEHTFTITRRVFPIGGTTDLSSGEMKLTLSATHNVTHWVGQTTDLKYGDSVTVKSGATSPDGLTAVGTQWGSCVVTLGALPSGLDFDYQLRSDNNGTDASIIGTIQEGIQPGSPDKTMTPIVQCKLSNGLLTPAIPISFVIKAPAL